MMKTSFWQVLYSLGALLLIRFILVSVYRLTYHPLAIYPGPWLAKITDFYSAYHALTGNLHLAMKACHDKYGTRVRFGPNKLIINDPECFLKIYNSPHVTRAKGFSLMTPTPGKYNLISTIDKKDHQRKRRILAAGFSDNAFRRFQPEILSTVDLFIEHLLDGFGSDGARWARARNMADATRYLSFDIIGKFAFGYSFNTLEKRDNRFVMDVLSVNNFRTGVYIQFPALEKWKLEIFYPKIIFMRSAFFKKTAEIARYRLNLGKDAKPDVFSVVSSAQDPDTGDCATFEELWAESTFLTAAGSDTVAATLSALFFYLTAYPDVYQRLSEEVRSIFGDADVMRHGGRTLMRDCIFLQACLKETLRMNPPVGSAPYREVGAPGIEIDGQHIPEGIDIGTSLYALQQSQDIFKEPQVFRPERWLTKEEAGVINSNAFAAFGAGPTRCLGQAFAMREMALIVARTLSSCDFRRVEGALGNVGAGGARLGAGRNDRRVFQTWDRISSTMDGPWLQFRPRQ